MQKAPGVVAEAKEKGAEIYEDAKKTVQETFSGK